MGYSAALFLVLVGLECCIIYGESQEQTETDNVSTEDAAQLGLKVDDQPADLPTKHKVITDADIEPTPDICPRGIRCGFQIYDGDTKEPSCPFIKYCNCPKGSTCVRAGHSMTQRFFYYKCEQTVRPEDVVMPPEYTTTEPLIHIFDLKEQEDDFSQELLSTTGLLGATISSATSEKLCADESCSGEELEQLSRSRTDKLSTKDYGSGGSFSSEQLSDKDKDEL